MDSRDQFLEQGYRYLASRPRSPASSPPVHVTRTETFCRAAAICREFLSTFLAGPVLDSLSESARQAASPALPGHMFCFSVFCGDRQDLSVLIYLFFLYMQGVSKKVGLTFRARFELFRGFRSKTFSKSHEDFYSQLTTHCLLLLSSSN